MTRQQLTPVHRAMIDAAITAPSPDNNQPWLFRVSDDHLQVFLDRRRSLPSDEASMFDMTAIGAAVENAVIAASHEGYSAEAVWQTGEGNEPSADRPLVEIRLQSGGMPDPLYWAIGKRCTCRKPFAAQPLEPNLLRQLEQSAIAFPDVQIHWLTSRKDKAKFGKLIARTDSLRFRTKPFHEELFRQLRFSRSEAEKTRDGLDVRTLELPPGVATMLRSLRSWNVMRVIHGLRLTPLLTAPSAGATRKSGAIAVVSVPSVDPEVFLRGGRAIQRLWLAAADANLSMHPLGSLPIFLLQSQPKPQFRHEIENARREVASLLPTLGNRIIQLAFRIGRSDPPTERSLRRPATDVLR